MIGSDAMSHVCRVRAHLLLQRALILAGVLIAGPGAAWACMPSPHGYEAPTRFEGEAGEVIWRYDEYDAVRLGPAQNLGGGFAVQYLRDGNGCYGEVYTIVQDCATGEAVAYGGQAAFAGQIVEGDDGVFAGLERLNEFIEERARLGDPLSIDDISAVAETRGIESVVPMRTDSHIRQGEGEFQLGEACRMFYPDLSPAPDP